MDYLVTFEDGSSGYLSHHGVKGMKWGVWNEETKARHNAKPMPSVEIYKAANKGQAYGDKLREKYSKPVGEGPLKTEMYSDKDWDKINKSILQEGKKRYKDVDVIGGKYRNFTDAAYDAVEQGQSKRLMGEYYVDRVLGSEKRSNKLNRLDNKISKTAQRQKEISSKYGPDSSKNKKALKKYGKAKRKFETEYSRLNPERAEFYKLLD